MRELEDRNQHYLFKLRLTKEGKRCIERDFFGGAWTAADADWQGLEGELRLSGWDHQRRVVLLRRQLRGEQVRPRERQSAHSTSLAFARKEAFFFTGAATGVAAEKRGLTRK